MSIPLNHQPAPMNLSGAESLVVIALLSHTRFATSGPGKTASDLLSRLEDFFNLTEDDVSFIASKVDFSYSPIDGSQISVERLLELLRLDP